MTVRSVLLGLLGAVLVCAVTFFNDIIMRGTFLVGNFIPFSVFGALILFVLLVNPLLSRISRRAALSGRELAVIAALTLFACYIPGRGLMHYFGTFLMLPHHYARTNPAWQGGPPPIEKDDVRDWAAAASALKTAAAAPQGDAFSEAVGRLPVEVRAKLADLTDKPESRPAIIEALNLLLSDRALAKADLGPDVHLPTHVQNLRRGSGTLPDTKLQALNRGLVEQWLGDSLAVRRPGALELVRPQMLADPAGDSGKALDGFVTGLAKGEEKISLRAVPWAAWTRTLLFWVPIILTVSVASIGLALVVHRQWTSHEHLPYPTVEFARALLPEEGESLSRVFRNRLFWIGAVAVMTIHLNNYACVWWPDKLIRIQINFDLRPLLEIVPIMKNGPWGLVFAPSIFFTAVGFAYFLASDVSLSLGIAPYFFCLLTGVLTGYGIPVYGGWLRPTIERCLYAGAYVGMFLSLAYVGRRYYLTVLGRGLGLRMSDRAEPHAVWGMRVFLACSVLFVVQVMMVGVDWQMAALYWLGLMLIFVVLSRLLAEAGVFFVHAYFSPCMLLTAFLGARAAGVDQLLVLAMLSTLLVIDPREAVMPFVISGIQLVEKTKAKIGGTAAWGTVALALGFAVAIPVTLYLHYQYGLQRSSDGWTRGVPTFPFDVSAALRQKLEAHGALGESLAVSGWGHFTGASADQTMVVAFLATFSMVLLFMFLRHRFAWWPLHPVLFLVLGTWQSSNLAFSFLLGWFIKTSISKYGGSRLYNSLKPLVIGLIAGEMVGGFVPIIVGAIYYFATGQPPPLFRVLPT